MLWLVLGGMADNKQSANLNSSQHLPRKKRFTYSVQQPSYYQLCSNSKKPICIMAGSLLMNCTQFSTKQKPSQKI